MPKSATVSIFSLSIDEDVRWAVTQIDSRNGAYVSVAAGYKTAGNPLFDLALAKPIDLERSLRKALRELKEREPKLLDSVVAVGVSSVGIIDVEEKLLLNFDRRIWQRRTRNIDGQELTYMVDFADVLREAFSADVGISVQNDATAKAMAEYEHSHKKPIVRGTDSSNSSQRDVFCYANFHYGVNAGYVIETLATLPWSAEQVTTSLHQEVGHTCAPPIPKRPAFNHDYSGCPVHKTCFVGVASGTRVENQWGTSLVNVPFKEEDEWNPRNEIAFLAAHFLHNVVLHIAPANISLAGIVIFPQLVDLIKIHFDQLNRFKGGPYINYSALRQPNFIQMARLTVEEAGVMGGLELARRLFRPSPRETKPADSPPSSIFRELNV